MSFTFGFYNSLDGDRKYSAEQISEIFDGIIEDGVFASIEELFAVRTAENGMNVIVGPGRAWFDHTWNKNDSDLTLTIDHSDPLLSRYDTIVIEVDASVSSRTNSIKVIKGENAVTPVKPTLIDEGTIHQHPLAYILVGPDVTEIRAVDIENAVGTAECPLVTGALETTDIDVLFRQWEGEFDDWFENVKDQLGDNVVTNLILQIDRCVKKSNKATDADISAGTADKWVDAASIKPVLESTEKKKNMVEFLTSGTWTAPSNIRENKIHVWCAGGGGGGGAGTTTLGGGGGGGGYITEGDFVVTPGNNYIITIGAGGSAGEQISSTAGGDGGAGGKTSFDSVFSANGGIGGTGYNNATGAVGRGGNGGSGGGGCGYAGVGGTGSGGGNGGSAGGYATGSYNGTDHAGAGGISSGIISSTKYPGGGGGGYGGNGGSCRYGVYNAGGGGGGGFWGNGGNSSEHGVRGGGGGGGGGGGLKVGASDLFNSGKGGIGGNGVVRIEYYITGEAAS